MYLNYLTKMVQLMKLDQKHSLNIFLFRRKNFYEIKRVLNLKKINFSTIDFEKTVLKWLKIKDEWKDFMIHQKSYIRKTLVWNLFV